jgi:cystathionine beta-lyase
LDFDLVSLEQVRKRRGAKWAMFENDVLSSAYAEMDFPLAPAVDRAVRAALDSGDLGYAYSPGAGLGEAFADFAQRRWGWAVDPEAVVPVPDVIVGVAELLRILTSPNAGVVINTPVYPPFFAVIRETGRQVVEVPMLHTDAGWKLPVEGIGEALSDGAEAVLLCNPHNPTGYVAKHNELADLAGVVAEHNAVVLSDEIHAPLTMPGAKHIPFCSLSREAMDHAIALTSATKAWNIAGLKCGLVVAPSTRLRKALEALPEELPERVGHLGVLASVAAFREGEQWLDELLAYLDETRHWLPRLLDDLLPGIVYEPGDATFLAWLDCRKLDLGTDPAAYFLEHARVGLSPGLEFGSPGRGFARLNIGTSRAIVEEAVTRMAGALTNST